MRRTALSKAQRAYRLLRVPFAVFARARLRTAAHLILSCTAKKSRIQEIKNLDTRTVWQGKKASNPRPTVLETAALPAELFPYKIGGPSGTRTPDRPVMSRLL